MLSNINITCFAGSYFLTLGLEISRPFFRLRARWIIMIVFALAGLTAHTAYLWNRLHAAPPSPSVAPLSSWYEWCLVVAWVLAIAYLGLALSRPENTLGLFLIPLILGLVAAAYAVSDTPPFTREEAVSYWALCHSVLLLLGTVVAALGFATGVMYLLQSYRLKRKLLAWTGFRLPSLEWLQRYNRRSLWLSSGLLALGLLAGLVLNAIRHPNQQGTVSWTDPVVLASTVLFFWLAAATLFEWFYEPARQGRKVAYVTLVSFVCLVLVLSLVLWGQHGISQTIDETAPTEQLPRTTGHLDPGPGRGGAR